MAVPCRVEDLADDPDYRARMHQITGRHAYAILETVQELARLGRITHPVYDLMGKDAVVFRHSKTTGDAADAQFVDQAQGWFDSMRDHISYEFPA